MQYWLLKSEPDVWAINQQEKVGAKGTIWDGVRNYQARNNLMKMKKGDHCFFYHSVNEKSVIGIVEVHKEYYPDPTDKSKRFVAIDVKALKKLKYPVTLDRIKRNNKLQKISLIKQSRLSVMPLTINEFKEIIKLSNKDE